MAGRGPQTFKKRQKEQQRKEKQQEKLARKLQRKLSGEVETGIPDEETLGPDGLPIQHHLDQDQDQDQDQNQNQPVHISGERKPG